MFLFLIHQFRTGDWSMKEIGRIGITRLTQDNHLTLGEVGFYSGDYLDVALISPQQH
jgi:hypothetical protein